MLIDGNSKPLMRRFSSKCIEWLTQSSLPFLLVWFILRIDAEYLLQIRSPRFHCDTVIVFYREWTKEEDDRLIALVKVMTVNGNVQWDKGKVFFLKIECGWFSLNLSSVTFYMPGRHRQQVRSRYQRTLDENVRHGRWTDHEDLVLYLHSTLF